MKSSSIIAIGGGVAAVIVIAVVMATMPGISVSPESSENSMDETIDTGVLQEDKIRILASFYPYYEFTKNVAGDSATVAQYMPSGVEAHDWEPRPQEIQSLKGADVFVYNGLGMEPYVDKLIDSGEFDSVLFVKVSEGIELIKPGEGHDDHAEDFGKEIEHVIEEFEHGHIDETQILASVEGILHEHQGDGHEHGNETIEKIELVMHEIKDGHMSAEEGFEEIHHIVLDIEGDHGTEEEEHGHDHDFELDPHIWLDPILVKQQVGNIRDGLIEADPQNREHYEDNAMAYIEKLDELDMTMKSSLTSCGKDTFVPFHNAFTYLAERYDLKVMSLSGLAPDSEATAAEIAEFIDFVKDNDIKVIFSEELVDPRLAQVIADEAGAEVMLFSPLETLSPEEIGKNMSYIDKMRQNMDSLKVALECQ